MNTKNLLATLAAAKDATAVCRAAYADFRAGNMQSAPVETLAAQDAATDKASSELLQDWPFLSAHQRAAIRRAHPGYFFGGDFD